METEWSDDGYSALIIIERSDDGFASGASVETERSDDENRAER